MAQLESFYSHQLSEILSENPWSQGSNDLFSPTLNEWDLVWNGREGNAEDACQSGSPSDSNATTNPHWQQYATNLYATTDTQNEYGQGGQELVADNTVHQGSGATVYDNSGPFFSSVMPPAGFENQPLYLPSVSQCHQPPLLPTTTSTYREPDNTVTLPQACPAPLRASGWPSQPQPEVFRYYKPPLPSRLSTPYSETSSRTVSPSVPPTSSKKTRSTAKPYRRSDHDEFDLALAALNRPPQPYPCVCGEIVYEANLACHLKERHGLTGKNLLCPWPECETTLQDVSALRRHCLTAQGHLGKKTPCPACLNEFTRSDRARSHFFNNCPVRGSLSRGSSGPSKVKRTGKTRRSR